MLLAGKATRFLNCLEPAWDVPSRPGSCCFFGNHSSPGPPCSNSLDNFSPQTVFLILSPNLQKPFPLSGICLPTIRSPCSPHPHAGWLTPPGSPIPAEMPLSLGRPLCLLSHVLSCRSVLTLITTWLVPPLGRKLLEDGNDVFPAHHGVLSARHNT